MITQRFNLQNAIEFDGTDDYVEVPNTPSNLFGSQDFTLSFWIYVPQGANLSGIDNPIQKGNRNNPGFKVELYDERANNTVVYAAWRGKDTQGNILAADFAIPLDQWTHLVMVRNGNDPFDWRYYTNGVQLISTGNSNLARTTPGYVFIFNSSAFVFDLTSNTNLGLGAELTNNTRFFEGKLDELIIQHSKISAAEVSWRYGDGKGQGARDLRNLQLYYTFNQNQFDNVNNPSNTQVIDKSQNNYNGTMYNFSSNPFLKNNA
jgi:hypothetical protein